MVRPRILPNNKDRVGAIEVIESDGTLANSNDFSQREARRLMAEVGAVGQVIRAELPHKELIQEGRLVAGPPGCVKDRLIRAAQSVKLVRNHRERFIPGNRFVKIAS
jgi:hypothetical protein